MKDEVFNSIRDTLISECGSGNTDTLNVLLALMKIGRKHLQEYEEEKAKQAKEKLIRDLKALKPQSVVYTRLIGDLFGARLRKIRDGKTYMLVCGNEHHYRVPYSSLQIEPLNSHELHLGKIMRQ